jgi:phosphoribosylformylglycinamidine synthase
MKEKEEHKAPSRSRRKSPEINDSKTFKAVIKVVLKKSVLDPQGTAVERALRAMGNQNVKSVRVGKIIEIVLHADDDSQAKELASEWADQFLANVNMETYEISLEELL